MKLTPSSSSALMMTVADVASPEITTDAGLNLLLLSERASLIATWMASAMEIAESSMAGLIAKLSSSNAPELSVRTSNSKVACAVPRSSVKVSPSQRVGSEATGVAIVISAPPPAARAVVNRLALSCSTAIATSSRLALMPGKPSRLASIF